MARKKAISTDLLEGETLLRRSRQHWIALVVPTLSAISLTVIFFLFNRGLDHIWQTRHNIVWVDRVVLILYIAGLLKWAVPGLIAWITTIYVFTSERIVTRSGLLFIKGESLPLTKVNSIQFSKTLLERVFGSGSLTIESAADNRVLIKHVTHAEEIQLQLDSEIASRREFTTKRAPRKKVNQSEANAAKEQTLDLEGPTAN